MTYEKISEMTAATAIVGTEVFELIQSSASVKVTPAQLKTYIDGTGATATTVITGEYIFTEDNELDYSSSITEGMSAATITFTQLPTTTVAVLAYMYLTEAGTEATINFKRSAAGTQEFYMVAAWADGGTNKRGSIAWLPTSNNTIRIIGVGADASRTFKILGYKTGA